MAILKGVRRVSDAVKLTMLLPSIEVSLSSTSSEVDVHAKEMHVMALEVFDSSAAKELNADESSAWPVLIRALECYHGVGKSFVLLRCAFEVDVYLYEGTATTQWSSLCATLRGSVFNSLSAKRQLELCLKLIELGSTMDSEVRFLPSSLNLKQLIDGLLFIRLRSSDSLVTA